MVTYLCTRQHVKVKWPQRRNFSSHLDTRCLLREKTKGCAKKLKSLTKTTVHNLCYSWKFLNLGISYQYNFSFLSSNFRFQYSDSQLSQFGIILRARSPVDAVNLAGKTPLHVACAWGQEQVVEAACMLGGIMRAELDIMWAELYISKQTIFVVKEHVEQELCCSYMGLPQSCTNPWERLCCNILPPSMLQINAKDLEEIHCLTWAKYLI